MTPRSRPPDRPKPPASTKPAATKPGTKPAPPPKRAAPRIGGNMTVNIQIGDVTVTITGPLTQVVAVMDWLFGDREPAAVIARLRLVFGPETPITMK